jgi:hypothetical protein
VGQRKPPEPDNSPEEGQRLYAELFQSVARLVSDGGVDAEELRETLKTSFLLTASAEQRESYDALRVEIDAYLRSMSEGQAVIRPPDGFVASPDITMPTIEELIEDLADDDESSH